MVLLKKKKLPKASLLLHVPTMLNNFPPSPPKIMYTYEL